jgi:hypothetical protein
MKNAVAERVAQIQASPMQNSMQLFTASAIDWRGPAVLALSLQQ